MKKTTHIISRAEQFLLLVLLITGLALLLAGCGSSNKEKPAIATGGSSGSFIADAYRYSACMRTHGVPSFPDPHVVANSPGRQAVGIHPLPKSIASSPQFTAAEKACKAIMPEPQNANPREATEHERARARYGLAFAQCLRSHGVPGFPDPTAQGHLTLEMIHAAGVDLQAPSVLAAARVCVGVTHGAITLAQVEQAIHHASGSGSSGGH